VTAVLYAVTSRTFTLLLALQPLGSVATAFVLNVEKFCETVAPGVIGTCPEALGAKNAGSSAAQSSAGRLWRKEAEVLVFMAEGVGSTRGNNVAPDGRNANRLV
jgi:hypothetical protein